jgi:hypothetical protein
MQILILTRHVFHWKDVIIQVWRLSTISRYHARETCLPCSIQNSVCPRFKFGCFENNIHTMRTWYGGEYRRRRDGKYSACCQQELPSNLLDITRSTRRMLLVGQELLTLPEHMSSHPVFNGVRVTRSLVLYVCFVDRCLSFCSFLLAIVLSVLLRYTNSDYPLGILNLFLYSSQLACEKTRPNQHSERLAKIRKTTYNVAA